MSFQDFETQWLSTMHSNIDTTHKQLKFSPTLVPLILTGEKTVTWRLWDDKDLKIADIVDFIEDGSLKKFAQGKLISATEKRMGNLNEKDKAGHENFGNDDQVYTTYSRYYGRSVDASTLVKIVTFRLIR